MGSKKPTTDAGLVIIRLLASGQADQDLQIVRNALAKAWRDLAERNATYPKYKVGDQTVVREDANLRYLPGYVRGATVEIVTVLNRYDRKLHKMTDEPSGDYTAQVVELKHKARGGPRGTPARADVGMNIHVSAHQLVPVDNDRYQAEFEEIKTSYSRRTKDR